MPSAFYRLRAILPAALAVLFLAPCARADEEVLRFTQTKVDIGAITDVEPVMRAFSFVNITNRSVRVAMSYCHFCSEPILDKQFLHPGETGTVVLEINPAGRKGQIFATATIEEEGKRGSGASIEFKAEVCPRVWVEPANIFPKIVRGDGASATFTVMGRTRNFKVKEVKSDAPLESVELGPTAEIDDCGSKATTQTVTIRFPSDLPIGSYANSLHVLTTDDRAEPRLVTAVGEVIGKVRFDPGNIGLRLTPGEAFVQDFELVVIPTGGAVLLDSIDITQRDEARDLALDVHPTSSPTRLRVTLSGRAPFRERQFVEIRLQAVVRALDSSGPETLTIPVGLVVFNTPTDR